MNNSDTNDEVRAWIMVGDQRPITEFLVPVLDEPWQDRGTRVAADLARRLSLPLHFVHMSGSGEAPLSVAPARVSTEPPDVEVRSTTIEGDDVAAVVRAVAKAGSVIVLATDNAREWTTTQSVGETLVRTAVDPVVLCGPNVSAGEVSGSIVVALDGSPTAEVGIGLGLSMARSLGVSLWLAQVVDTTTSARVRALADAGDQVSESAYLRDVVDRVESDGVDVGWEILHNDDAVSGIVEFAAKQGAGLVVAASHGASGLSHQLFGSTCLGIVEHASSPVMIGRPSRRNIELQGSSADVADEVR